MLDINLFNLQVQCQLFCTQRSYCDFVVWTEKEVRIERIYPDNAFWLEHVQRVKHFFTVGILPELIGKFYSRPTTTSTFPQVPSTSESPNPAGEEQACNRKYCYCHEDKEGEMIGCDNQHCPYEWFHFSCLKLSSKPKSKLWYCPDCRKLPEFRRKTSKKAKTTDN